MFDTLKTQMSRTLIAAATLVSAVSISAAASAGEYWTPSNAPITYKMANPADMMGYNPAPAPLPQHAARTAAPAPTGPVFDPNRVDQTLYSHQRVGKTYTVAGQTYTPAHQPRYDMVGTASWYGDKFHGKLTANGEKYDKNGMTAAHKTLPLNSLVVVTNLKTGVALTLRINDRGPFVGKRIIDLSEAAAKVMGITTTGLGEVRVQYAGPADLNGAPAPQQAQQQPQRQLPVQPMPPVVLQQQAEQYAPIYQAPAPIYQAPAPIAPQQQYQPLRDMNQPAAPAPAPKLAELAQPQFQIPKVMNPVSIIPQAALPAMPYAAPQAYIPPSNGMPQDNTVVTMTIKGPIHMATQGAKDARGQLIQVVNRTTYKTVK